jgi:hypothetical protein
MFLAILFGGKAFAADATKIAEVCMFKPVLTRAF